MVPEWLSPKILARIPGAFRKVIVPSCMSFVGGGPPMCGFLLTSDSSRMISFQKVIVKPRSGSASLHGPVALETEEQRLEREQNERGVQRLFLKHWRLQV